MTLDLTVELTDLQVAALKSIPDTWHQHDQCRNLPFWAFHSVPVYSGYDWSYKISELGRQAREKLQ